MAIPMLHLNDVSQAIQLALAPAFLLTSLAGLLNVMAGRLARIIDRGRHLTETEGIAERLPGHVRDELRQLDRRRHLASTAIGASTLASLLLCLVVSSLFVEVYLGTPLRGTVGVLFMLAMLSLIVSLSYFLREVHLATTSIRIAAAGSER